MCLRKLMSGRGRYFGMGWETLGQWQWTKPGLCTHEKFSGKKEKQKDERDSSGTWYGGARKGSLWLCSKGFRLGDRKLISQVVGEDRSRLPGRGIVGEVRRGGKKASDRTKERVHRVKVRFRRERKKRASCLPCLSLSFGDDRRGMSGSRDVSLTIFITSISGGRSLTSFTNRFNFS